MQLSWLPPRTPKNWITKLTAGDREAETLYFFFRALVAQLDRASGYEPEGRGFDSLPARQNISLQKLQSKFSH